jgi:hypothetical protein
MKSLARLGLIAWTLLSVVYASWVGGSVPSGCSFWCYDFAFVVAMVGLVSQLVLGLGAVAISTRRPRAVPVAYVGVAIIPFVGWALVQMLAPVFDPGRITSELNVAESAVDDISWTTYLVDAAASDGVLVVAQAPSRVWTTVDGSTWKAVPEEGLGPNAKLESLVAWDGGVAAIGNDVGNRSWMRQRDGTWVRGGSDGIGPFEAVAVAHGNGLIAVGADPRDVSSAVAWISTDGLAWSEPHSIGSGQLSGVESLSGGLVAVGRAGRLAAVWASSDGVSWRQAAIVPDAVSLSDVIEFRSRLIAVGVAPNAGGGVGRGLIATSEDDGATWKTTFNDLGPLFDVVVFNDRAIGVGLETMVVSEDGIQWTELTTWPQDIAVPRFERAFRWGDRLVVSGTGEPSCGCVLLVSDDAEHWSSLAP